jgi:xanthine dehydrogenase accessory factor
MHEVILRLAAINHEGRSSAMATVVATWRSSPQAPGTSMLITDTAEAIGSVSGGCVEGALFVIGQEVLADGPPRYETFSVSDDSALSVGLDCGGVLEVFVERVDSQTWPELDGSPKASPAACRRPRYPTA